MVKLSKYILGLLLPMLALSSCSKMESGMDDLIQVLPPVEEEEKVPSKYQDGDLVSMVFTVEESEETKITLGEEGTDGSRRVSWDKGDSVMFVWGPDAEDCCIGVAQKTDVKTDFVVDKIFKDAKTVYAVTPASAYHSFVKSANWDTDGTGTVKVDTRKQGGSFEDAYIAVARTSLETRKMRFKTLCGYVAVNPTNFIVGGFKLENKGTQAISAVIPVTAEMSGDYTGNLNTEELEDTSTVVVAQSSVAGNKFYVAVLPGSSFATGMTLSYLDAYGVTVGAATLRNNTSVAKNNILEFASSLNQYFSRDYYVKVDGSGNKDGSSWDNAWSLTEMMTYTKDVTKFESGLKSDAVINIHVAAGTYQPTSTIVLNAKYLEDPSDKSDEWKLSNCRKYNLLGGYPDVITNDTAADSPRNWKDNPTIISGSSMAENINMINLVAPVRAGVSGFTVSDKTTNATGINAFRFTINEGVVADMQAEVKHCKFANNKNTSGVGAAMAIAMNEQGPLYHDITIEDCEFTGNSSGAGPAINIDGNYAQPKIYNCVFKENKVNIEYIVGKQTHGGAVKVSRGSPTFKNCTFEGNSTAHGSGGAVWLTDETAGSAADGGGTSAHPFVATFENCTFTGNTTTSAYGKGGAVYVARFYEANFNNCTFTGNKTTTSSENSYGGAIMVGACRDNESAPVMRGNVHALNLNNCHFENNLVNRTTFAGAVPGGCAVVVYQPENYEVNVNIDGGVFKNHTAPYVEGVVLYGASGTLSVKNATFSKNTNEGTSSAKATASVLYVKDCKTTVENSHFDQNTSTGGGTIYLDGQGDFSMRGGSMTNNTSPAGAPAFRVSSNFNSPTYPERVVSVNGVTFTGNYSTGGYGGAVAIYKNTNADFTSCQFIGNYTTNRAGAFYVSGENGATNTVTLDSCTFTGNYAQDGAGALEVSNKGNPGYSTYKGFDHADNVLAASFDQVTVYDSCKVNLVVRHSTFTANHTTQTGGGAIGCQTSGTVQIQDCEFHDNYTDNNNVYASGGAISIAAGNVGTSVSAGVIENPKEGDFSIERCLFEGNHTKGNAGSYGVDVGGAIVIQRGTKVGNQYAISKAKTKIFQCTFRENNANQGGALAIMADSSRTYLSNCLFYKNHVTYAIGPDIHRNRDSGDNGGGLFINNTTFYGSWSQGGWNGARINLQGGHFVLANSTIIGTSLIGDGVADPHVSTEGLIRFDGASDGTKIHFINSIVCNTETKGYAFTGYNATINLVNDKPTTGARGFMTTLASPYTYPEEYPMTFTLPNHDNPDISIGGSTLQAYGTTTYFPQLQWIEGNKTWDSSYWKWNGIPKAGYGYASMLYNMNNDLKNTAPDFYAWLASKGVVSESTVKTESWGKDQRMELRGNQSVADKSKHLSFPGAYDAGTRSN